MRLLHVQDLKFTEFRDETKLPKYVIASHRWVEDEVTFKDVQEERGKDKAGYKKVEDFARYVREKVSSIEWLWIDTCCINKDSDAELSYAINSMFRWYRNAEVCIAYLPDVEAGDKENSFRKSEWFKRGWTLQELLAPRIVVFVTREWHVIGNKGSAFYDCEKTALGSDLVGAIARITGLSEHVLNDWGKSIDIGVDEKMKWIHGRTTTVKEDMAYALFGIVGVTPGTNYGEGYEGARQRLLAAIRRRDETAVQQADQYLQITNWLSPPNVWTNHESARKLHERKTGAWLLQSREYQAWKSELIKYVWVYGQPGCGKTILCSTAFEDIRAYCQERTNIGHVIFYFSFSDNETHSFEKLVCSLVVQLGWKEPGLSTLLQAYKKRHQGWLGLEKLQRILLSCFASYTKVFLHLDALDECPEGDGLQRSMAELIGELLQQAPNVHVLITSRDIPDVRRLTEEIGAQSISIAAQTIRADIQRYLSTQLARSQKLSRLDAATRTLIEETLLQKSGGMFRWVYCQLQQLNKSKSTKPSVIEKALRDLPATLDETYQRMLNAIDEEDRSNAYTLLRWLAYAQSPMSLSELAEASIIDPTEDSSADGTVDIHDRPGWHDALEILTGLVSTRQTDERDRTTFNDTDEMSRNMHFNQRVEQNTRITLAHFSIKEYLESSRILASDPKNFHLNPAKEHRFITQSCLVYLTYYSNSAQKTLSQQDLVTFPLLEYAAKSWCHHALLQQWSDSTREIGFFTTGKSWRDWLHVYTPDSLVQVPFLPNTIGVRTALYYVSFTGLEKVVKGLLDAGADINAEGGNYGNALQAASFRGDEKVVQMLLDAGADINARGGYYGSALQAASSSSNEKVVQMLLDAGADINAQEGHFGNALQIASYQGNEKAVQMLLDAGADFNAQGGNYGNALQAASYRGDEKVVQMLLNAGADINAQGGKYGNALQAASPSRDKEKVVQMLLDAGADINARGGYYGNALQAASYQGGEKVVQRLLDAGADINAQGGKYRNALQAASLRGDEKVVQMLLDAGADVNAQGGKYGNALQAASPSRGKEKVVQILLDAGADVNAQGGHFGNALQAASYRGNEKAVQMLLDAGADVNVQGGRFGNALWVASIQGDEKIIQMLLGAGAHVDVDK